MTAALGAGMHMVSADGTALAVSTQPVSVDGAELTGRIEQRAEGVYGVIGVTNRTDALVAGRVSHAAYCTPGANMRSRMMPMPKQEHKGDYSFRLAPGEGDQTEFLIQAAPPAVTTPPVAVQVVNIAPVSAPTWSLVVSRGTITQPMWGGMLSPTGAAMALPAEGQVVLAHSRSMVAPVVVAQVQVAAGVAE
jgi:hypothetical protein